LPGAAGTSPGRRRQRGGDDLCRQHDVQLHLEEIAEEATGDLWFQLYLWRQAEMIDEMIDRVGAAGYRALVVTVDVPVIGKRVRDLRNGFVWPPSLRLGTAADMLRHPRWLRQQVPLPESPTSSMGVA